MIRLYNTIHYNDVTGYDLFFYICSSHNWVTAAGNGADRRPAIQQVMSVGLFFV
ncbi:MAG: hypothetical protein K0R67_3426 [Paenibacillus sp.]|nr:hypothetical protein [Paenibacillus sp.]